MLAVVTKFAGAYLGAMRMGRRDATFVGVGMVPRGEVGIIVAGIGNATGTIDGELFAIIVGDVGAHDAARAARPAAARPGAGRRARGLTAVAAQEDDPVAGLHVLGARIVEAQHLAAADHAEDRALRAQRRAGPGLLRADRALGEVEAAADPQEVLEDLGHPRRSTAWPSRRPAASAR